MNIDNRRIRIAEVEKCKKKHIFGVGQFLVIMRNLGVEATEQFLVVQSETSKCLMF